MTAFLDELILGLEEEVEQGIITNWQCSEYICLTEIALERILNNYPLPGEVVRIYSEALRVLDQNTMKYMIDQLQGVVNEQKEQLASKDATIAENLEKSNLLQQDNAALRQLLAEHGIQPPKSSE